VDPAAWTAIGGVIVALIAALSSPQIIKRLEARDPTRGWQAAIKALQDRVDSQDRTIQEQGQELKNLRTLAEGLEDQVRDKDRTISDLSRINAALASRVIQLESAWPTAMTLPPIDPAHRAILQARLSSGG